MKWLLTVAWGIVVLNCAHAAVEWPDRVSEVLTFASADGNFFAHGEGLLSVTGYKGNQSIPGLVFSEQDPLLSPRLTLFVDGQAGSSVSGFVQARIDRGFDPTDGGAELRFDEYALRFRLGSGTACSIQVGKFATVFGNWVPRHDEWQNPFVCAPLPYENLTGIYDAEAAVVPQNLRIDGGADDYDYNPIIWGPVYATGVSVAGRVGRFDYAVEMKNTGPSSRPESWTLGAVGFDQPAYTMRLGFRPDLRLNFGLSVSDSVYLLPRAAATIPAGFRRSDYREWLFGQDFSFEWHHWQIWSELFEAQFDVPLVGAARSLAGYVELRYKFTPHFSGALRWNRQVFSSMVDAGVITPWGTDLTRVEAAVLYRFTPQSQFKIQVSAIPAVTSRPGRLTYAAQFTLRF